MGGDGAPRVLDLIFNGGKLTKCHQPFKCNTDIDSSFGIVLWLMIMIYMFKQLGTICDEYYVPALEVIVERLEMSSDDVGATFMAAGSSAPEFFTSLVATFLIANEGGVGTIVQMVKLSGPLPNAVPCPSPLGPGTGLIKGHAMLSKYWHSCKRAWHFNKGRWKRKCQKLLEDAVEPAAQRATGKCCQAGLGLNQDD
mmetsp:Transcript_44546/g.74074  ORF Transcript_44546/g.74074 Transcript_44546/m.74074 type:complete len:197 (-) Transcript_44546:50-640(-)